MSISKTLGFIILAVLLISSTVAQSPAPAPLIGGGRRIISPSISPSPSKTPSTASPPTPSQAVSPSAGSTSALSPSSISDSPSQAPGPSQSDAVSNIYAVFGGFVAVILYAAALAL